jgi:hypothetical protein
LGQLGVVLRAFRLACDQSAEVMGHVACMSELAMMKAHLERMR